MIGETLSHFRILEKLGEGGMGVVYKAEDMKLRRIVALKCLRERAQHSDELRARFVREAQAAASLDHPNICSVFELGEEGDRMFLSMAYVEGCPLNRLREKVQIPLFHAVRIAIQIGQGLQAAHEKGIVHRDIKAANVLITPDGNAKITDFGLAQIRDRSRLTRPGTILGTITHMSPEQALAKATDRRTDIWSLGVVLYHLAEGRLPFRGGNTVLTMTSIVEDEFPPLTKSRDAGRSELERILRKALAKNADERFQHVDDFLVDLRALLKKLPKEPDLVFEPSRAAGADDATVTMIRATGGRFARESWFSNAGPNDRKVQVLVLASLGALVVLAAVYFAMR